MKDVSREFDEFGVNSHLCKLRCWYYVGEFFHNGRGHTVPLKNKFVMAVRPAGVVAAGLTRHVCVLHFEPINNVSTLHPSPSSTTSVRADASYRERRAVWSQTTTTAVREDNNNNNRVRSFFMYVYSNDVSCEFVL